MISIAIAISGGNVGAAALENVAWPIAHATRIIGTQAVVDIVADAVLVDIGGAGSSADADHIQLVAIAVAVAVGNLGTATRVCGTWSVAYATRVIGTYAGVFTVTNAIFISVGRACSATDVYGVQFSAGPIFLSGFIIIVARCRICTPQNFSIVADTVFIDICRACSIANAQGIVGAYAVIHIVAKTVGIGIGRTRTVACSQRIITTDAGIDIVADPISVAIGCAASATVVECIQLIAIAIAVARGNVSTTTVIDFTWTIAHATGVIGADTIVDVITHLIAVGIGAARPSANAEGIGLVAIAVAVSGGDVGASAVVDLTGAVAHAASVECAHAGVVFIADAIAIGVIEAIAVAVEPGFSIGAPSIGVIGTCCTEFRNKQLVLGAIGFTVDAGSEVGKKLTGDFCCNGAVGGELCNEDFSVCIGDALVVSIIIDVPQSANLVVHDEVVARFECSHPVLIGAGDGADIGAGSAVFRRVANGHVAVVHQIREEGKNAGHDARGRGASEGILVEGSGGGDADDRRSGGHVCRQT